MWWCCWCMRVCELVCEEWVGSCAVTSHSYRPGEGARNDRTFIVCWERDPCVRNPPPTCRRHRLGLKPNTGPRSTMLMKDSVKAPEIPACHATAQPSPPPFPRPWPYGRWSLSVGVVRRGEIGECVEQMKYIIHILQYFKTAKISTSS